MVGVSREATLARLRHKPKEDRTSYHIAPPKGWVNDPNGPLYYMGYYHMFYQHIPEGCTWSFGLVWGHAVSRDLVSWEHLSHAIVPTPGGLDSDGCFSGCATLDDAGVPTILYTGVRLRSNESAGPLPPHECDLQLPFIESQCAVRPVDPEDPKLTYWTKVEFPWLSLPPPNMGLGGWRDPYIIGRPGQDGQDSWSLVIGSGVKDNGGTVLVYTSKELLDGWELHGELCHGRGEGATTGFIWECPLLCKMDALPPNVCRGGVDRASNQQPEATTPAPPSETPYFFCVSPDACTNPSYYWLGLYDSDAKTFDLAGANGPYRLDLGDILYAPNTLVDSVNNRTLLWGWNQEKRTKVDAYDYAGCLSLPRVLWVEPVSSTGNGPSSSVAAADWGLHQQPLPELTQLRDHVRSWRLHDDLPQGADELLIDGGAKLPVPVVSGPFLDIELVLQPATASDGECCSASGLLLHSWRGAAEGAAALLYHWNTGVLEVVFEALDPATLTFSLAAPGARRVGGPLLRPPAPGSPLSLRVFLDYSCLEVFTGDGEVLTARVYRGAPPAGSHLYEPSSAGIDIISVDGPTRVQHAAAFEMRPAFGSGINREEEEAASEPLRFEALSVAVDASSSAPAVGDMLAAGA